jgi:hypothetical protein
MRDKKVDLARRLPLMEARPARLRATFSALFADWV